MEIIKNIKRSILGLAVAGLLSGCASLKHSMSIEGYMDTRGMYTATLVGNVSNLPLNTNMFGFIDLETEKGNQDNLKKPYGEIMLNKKAENGLGVMVEYNRDFVLPKGITRTGFIYEPNVNKISKDLFLGVKYSPTSSGNNGSQLGLYGEKMFNNGDFYISGWLDYDFKPDKTLVELQLAKKIKDNLYFVVEGRYNGYRRGDEKGIGVGLEWKF